MFFANSLEKKHYRYCIIQTAIFYFFTRQMTFAVECKMVVLYFWWQRSPLTAWTACSHRRLLDVHRKTAFF